MAGVFITVEGPDGAGKTTLVDRLAERLRGAGLDVERVRDPGGTPTAEVARQAVLDGARNVAPVAELFLYLAARADLVAQVVQPRLADGAVVLSDRFDLSTMAYQAAGRGLDREAVETANRLATGGLRPDLTVVLDVPPQVGRERQWAQGKAPDRLEREDEAYHDRVRRAFREAAGETVVHVDATGPAHTVEAAVWTLVQERLAETFARPTG